MQVSAEILAFFETWETGRGWEACAPYCTPDAGFSSQADALAEVTTVRAYADWMTGIIRLMPDGRYDILAAALDEQRSTVAIAAIFHATHTEPGGPVPPTGKSMSSEYCYVLKLEDGKVAHMTKIWNDAHALRQAGWT